MQIHTARSTVTVVAIYSLEVAEAVVSCLYAIPGRLEHSVASSKTGEHIVLARYISNRHALAASAYARRWFNYTIPHRKRS